MATGRIINNGTLAPSGKMIGRERAPVPSLAQGLSGSTMKRWAGAPKTDTEMQDAANARRAARAKPLSSSKPVSHADLEAATKSFPSSLKFEGKVFSRTGKVGTNTKSGLPSAEYRSYGQGGHEDDRVWRDSSGKVARD